MNEAVEPTAGAGSASLEASLEASLGAALREAARRFGSPVYVTSVRALEAAAAELRDAFPDPWLRAFSLKANDVPAIVARLGGLGLGANVVSAGEWSVARRAGIPNERVTLEGIGKTAADLRTAVRASAAGAPLRWVAIESPEELEALAAIAGRARLGREGRPPLDMLLRLNPDVTPETRAGLAVGRRSSKFGMTETELTAALAGLPDGGPLRARGIHLHVGSQLGAVDAWRDAVRRGLALLALLGAGRDGFDTLDVGGGFPVGEPGTVPSPTRFARELPALLAALPTDRRPARLAVEPGRFLVARAGWLVASVLHVRERPGAERVVVLDTGMTELIRPALYEAHHRIAALTSLGRACDWPARPGAPEREPGFAPARVDGPVCESTDTFGLHDLPPLRRGDLVAIADAGAYAASMAMTYNGRPRPPQVLLEPDGRLTLGRRRGPVSAG
jgi:diaminopimelate decarboxylase